VVADHQLSGLDESGSGRLAYHPPRRWAPPPAPATHDRSANPPPCASRPGCPARPSASLPPAGGGEGFQQHALAVAQSARLDFVQQLLGPGGFRYHRRRIEPLGMGAQVVNLGQRPHQFALMYHAPTVRGVSTWAKISASAGCSSSPRISVSNGSIHSQLRACAKASPPFTYRQACRWRVKGAQTKKNMACPYFFVQPRRPPKVPHLWPPKLLHSGPGYMTHSTCAGGHLMVDRQDVTFTPSQRGDHWSERLEATLANHCVFHPMADTIPR